MPTPRDVHNTVAAKAVTMIVQPMRDAGGDNADIIVLLETVTAGVLRLVLKEDQYDAACDLLAEQLKVRVRELQARARELGLT
jgi:hypothetical protein